VKVSAVLTFEARFVSLFEVRKFSSPAFSRRGVGVPSTHPTRSRSERDATLAYRTLQTRGERAREREQRKRKRRRKRKKREEKKKRKRNFFLGYGQPQRLPYARRERGGARHHAVQHRGYKQQRGGGGCQVRESSCPKACESRLVAPTLGEPKI
jgi:hypothetical protein